MGMLWLGVQALVHSRAYFLLGDAAVCGGSGMRAASWCCPGGL